MRWTRSVLQWVKSLICTRQQWRDQVLETLGYSENEWKFEINAFSELHGWNSLNACHFKVVKKVEKKQSKTYKQFNIYVQSCIK